MPVAASPVSVAEAFRQALEAQRSGRLTEAAAGYRRVLKVRPAHFGALQMLGVCHHHFGEFRHALKRIDEALAIDPRAATAHVSRANALRELGRPADALAAYRRAIGLAPDLADAHYNLGTLLAELGHQAQALDSYERAVCLGPGDLQALTACADTLQALGRLSEAVEGYRRALAAGPADPATHMNLGAVLTRLGRLEEALEHCDRALQLQPDSAPALCNRGALLNELGRFSEAVATLDRALALDPRCAPAWHFRGRAQARLRLADQALESYRRAIALEPDNTAFRHDMAAAFALLGRAEEVLEFFDAQVAAAPQDPGAITSRSCALFMMGRYAEAREGCERAVALDPGHARARFHLGAIDLLHGNFADGWEGYEWRWEDRTTALARRPFAAPLWNGAGSLEGRTLLIHAEQGLGDALQFCRYVPQLARRAERVLFEVPQPLAGLMRRSLGSVCEVVAYGDALPAFDLHAPLMSLPRALRTVEASIPAQVPYLQPDPLKVALWRGVLPACTGLRIGIAWSGNPGHRNDRQRSIALAQWEPLFARAPAASQFLALQTDVRETDREALAGSGLLFPGERIADFDDTAALAALCDLVITVDTSAVHLAGALACPVWVLLPLVPDWRWLLERSDSPWYPTARLFRQPRRGHWEDVIREAGGALAAFGQ